MARRREQRIRTILPVRVFGMDSAGKPFSVIGHTLDLTSRGARLGGLQQSLATGDIIGVQRGSDKARFRVVWTGTPGTRNEGQVGLVCIQENKNIWNIGFTEVGIDEFDFPTPAQVNAATGSNGISTAATREERRRDPRHSCDIGVEIRNEGEKVGSWARCTDISRGGCYVETRQPLPTGTALYASLRLDGKRIRARCVVRSSHPSFGMGMRFDRLEEHDLSALVGLIAELENGRTQLPDLAAIARLQRISKEIQSLESELPRLDHESKSVPWLRTMLLATVRVLDIVSRDTANNEDVLSLRESVLSERIRFLSCAIDELGDELLNDHLEIQTTHQIRASAEALLATLPTGPDDPTLEPPSGDNATTTHSN